MKWPIEVDSHRFSPNVWFLLPDDPLMGGADTVITYQDLDRPQSLLSLRDRVRAALWSSQICHRILEPDRSKILLTSRDAHHPCAT